MSRKAGRHTPARIMEESMDYIAAIERFAPEDEQEETDKGVILSFIRRHEDDVLLRDNSIAHITSSGFILNRRLDKVLLVHHNIRNAWAWTGGHADGNGDLIGVAIREATEETGVEVMDPLSREIASLDVLPVFAHRRRGHYVNAHLHLSVAYLLVCDELAPLRARPGENTDVAWFPLDYFIEEHFDAHDTRLYNKLIRRARTRAIHDA
ncbi:MAG TPA: NUDIX hydrolase [Clostridia bacterium]|nr:NUDIX hydrolase [Clostridia bacterium]